MNADSITGDSVCVAANRQSRANLIGLSCMAFLLFILQTSSCLAQAEPEISRLKDSFAHPPDDARIMMRWWWFGPAVTKSEIRRELEQMKSAGIGGVEIATLYPLALDDTQGGFHNMPFLSDEHLDALRFAALEARKLGLRVDITLGSGWPFGGPHIPISEAAGTMRIETVEIPSGVRSIAVPSVTTDERLEAVFLVPGSNHAPDVRDGTQIPEPVIDHGRLQIPSPLNAPHAAVFFISSRTGMTVKRPAIGAEGFVLDHYDKQAIETHLHAVGDRFMEAFGEHPPYAVFSDSLEDDGSDWTPKLLQEFQRRRGYDLTPHLLALIADVGPETSAIRHDWGKTLTELADQNYLQPLQEWARAHHTLFRSQTYGFPPVTLSSNQYEDLPEGEGKATVLMWRQFSDTRWAASAGHLFGKPVISSETWTWLHSPAFQATPLDMKAEADLHFLQGINQLVGHGWPYSPDMAGEPGWRMYAAGAFNAHNPWWFAMADLAAYLQRVSFALRQGKPASDVALLLPNDDAWAHFTVNGRWSSPVAAKTGFSDLGNDVSIDESMDGLLGHKVIPEILDAGFNLDFIDADAIDKLGIQYPILVLPGIERIPLVTYRKIEQYAMQGGTVVATRQLPSKSPGRLNADSESRQIQEISRRLFRATGGLGRFVEEENQLGVALASHSTPDLRFSPKSPEIGFIHRKLSGGDIYFIANTANHTVQTQAQFRDEKSNAESWDPFTGRTSRITNAAQIAIALQPYESRLIVFTNDASKEEPETAFAPQSKYVDISSDWKLTFSDLNQTITMAKLHSWSDEEAFKYYSGRVAYSKTIDVPAEILRGPVVLDFGEGTRVPILDPLPTMNMRAYLEGPVREAAEVHVNGQRVGVVWHPPYSIELTKWLKPGKNELTIVAGNTAINSLAGHAVPDYRLLNDRYGERFLPQGMDHLQPLPSGIVGKLQLRVTPQR
jgi:alpha-L-rhamnosidase